MDKTVPIECANMTDESARTVIERFEKAYHEYLMLVGRWAHDPMLRDAASDAEVEHDNMRRVLYKLLTGTDLPRY